MGKSRPKKSSRKNGNQRTGKNTELIFGVNPVREAMRAGRRRILKLILKEGPSGGSLKSLVKEAADRNIPCEFKPLSEIAEAVSTEGHQGVAAIVTSPVYTRFDKLLERLEEQESPLVILLDGVTDPRNMGAIIRSAEAFGAKAVIFPDRRAASYTPVAVKASAGAGERMTLCRVTNITDVIVQLQKELGFHCVALDYDANSDTVPLPSGPLALVMGDEGKGIRPLTRKRCDAIFSIPMTGSVGSLNVSAAAAIAIYLGSIRA